MTTKAGEIAHTQLPWEVGAKPNRIEPKNAPRYELNDGWIIADTMGPDADANAVLIVRAVNCHADLLEALKRALPHIPEDEPDFADTRELAERAIARARGEVGK